MYDYRNSAQHLKSPPMNIKNIAVVVTKNHISVRDSTQKV